MLDSFFGSLIRSLGSAGCSASALFVWKQGHKVGRFRRLKGTCTMIISNMVVMAIRFNEC